MDKDKVLNLAKLARIDMGEAEAEKLSKEFEAILGYVSEIKSIKPVSEEGGRAKEPIRNVMREDGEPHASSLYTEKILSQAPGRVDNYLKVKKIL